jgi:triosephosphate isomerase
MNKELDSIKEYIQAIKGKITDGLNVVICPSFPYLNYFKSNEYKLGAQNCFYEKEGSYTGEVSPYQLKSIGVDYIIVGHSERRIKLNETDDMIAKKVYQVLKQNIKAILCIGESKSEKELHKTPIVIKKQLLNALDKVDNDMIEDLVIAYEPVYAIGSGVIPKIDDIKEVIDYIKDIINNKYSYNKVKILYGGSVDKNNIKDIININGIDGVLIGGASLNPSEFIDILNQID